MSRSFSDQSVGTLLSLQCNFKGNKDRTRQIEYITSRRVDAHCCNLFSMSFRHYALTENEKNCVEKNVSTPGISIYFEAYLYSMGTYSSCPWQFLASSQLALQRRPSMGDDEEEHDSPVEGLSDKVKKPKKVYCYISPKVK